MDCKLCSQSHCRQILYLPRPPHLLVQYALYPKYCCPSTTTLFCKLFPQYFGYNGTIFFTVYTLKLTSFFSVSARRFLEDWRQELGAGQLRPDGLGGRAPLAAGEPARVRRRPSAGHPDGPRHRRGPRQHRRRVAGG